MQILTKEERSILLHKRVELWRQSTSCSSVSTHREQRRSWAVPLVVLRDLALACFIFYFGYYGRKYWKDYMLPSEEDLLRGGNKVLYQVTKSGDVVLDFRYNQPLVEADTIPGHILFSTCTYGPTLLVFLIIVGTDGMADALIAVSAMLTGLGTCELLTHLLKYYVLRPRPNFFAMCEFSTETRQCMSPLIKRVILAQVSFPSGHSSVSWCGMTFLALALMGMLQRRSRQRSAEAWPNGRFHQRHWMTKLCCMIPWSWATFVSASRVVDHWHHPSDVVAGSLLGILCAVVPYYACFPQVLSGTSYVAMAFHSTTHGDAESDAEEGGRKSYRELTQA